MGSTQSSLPLLQALNDDDHTFVDEYIQNSLSPLSLNDKLNVKDVRNPRANWNVSLKLTTCLCFACQFSTVGIVRKLVKAGADVRVTDSWNRTPLNRSCCSETNAKQKVQFLLECDASLMKVRNEHEHTPLIETAMSGNADIFGLLIQYGASINEQGECGWTALHYACWNGNMGCIDELIKLGADAEAREEQIGATPLLFAALTGHSDCVKSLVEKHGASINATTNGGDSALHQAALAGSADVIRTLFEYKDWDINMRGFLGQTPLHKASAGGHVSCIHDLISRGADVEARDTADEATPLHMAAYIGHVDCVRVLVETHHAAVNAVDKYKGTPLHCAASQGNADVIKLLTSYTACDVSLNDCDNNTAADIAQRDGHKDVAAFLTSLKECKASNTATTATGKLHGFTITDFNM